MWFDAAQAAEAAAGREDVHYPNNYEGNYEGNVGDLVAGGDDDGAFDIDASTT